MSSADYIGGYILPLIPMAFVQSIICYLVAFLLGMDVTVNVLPALVMTIPAALLFIGIGLLCGSVFNDKQVGGICGALLTNLTAWLSGCWFDLDLVGGAFKTVAYCLPFVHAVEMGKAAMNGDYAGIFPHLWWVLGYALVLLVVAVFVFKRNMKR